MLWFSNISASGVIGLTLLACAVVCSFGARHFCRRKGYDEEKTADVVYRAKMTALMLAIAATVLITGLIRF